MSLFLDDECFIPIENGHYFMCQKWMVTAVGMVWTSMACCITCRPFLIQPFPRVMVVVLVSPGSCQEGTCQCRHFSLCYYLTCLEIQGDKCVMYRTIVVLQSTHSLNRAPTEQVEEYKCSFVTTFKKLLDFPNDQYKFYNCVSSSLEKSVINKLCLSECFIEIIVTTDLQYFYSQISLKMYFKILELDIKSIDTADIKL